MEIISFWNNVNFEDFHRRHLQSGFTTDEFIVTQLSISHYCQDCGIEVDMASEHSDHLMIGSLITVAARSDDIVTIIHAEVVPGDIDTEFLNGMHLRFVNHVLQNGNEAQHKVRIFFVWDFFKHHSCLIL